MTLTISLSLSHRPLHRWARWRSTDTSSPLWTTARLTSPWTWTGGSSPRPRPSRGWGHEKDAACRQPAFFLPCLQPRSRTCAPYRSEPHADSSLRMSPRGACPPDVNLNQMRTEINEAVWLVWTPRGENRLRLAVVSWVKTHLSIVKNLFGKMYRDVLYKICLLIFIRTRSGLCGIVL